MFLVRFDSSNGTRIWTRLLGTASNDFGTQRCRRPRQPGRRLRRRIHGKHAGSGLPGSAGGLGGTSDAFVARYAGNGTRVWVRQFGSSG
jgi:hypothetical protein